MRSKIIGLTGSTGSGKSSIARILEETGALIIDADKIAHEVILQGQPAYFELIEYFGDILTQNGGIDRKKLAAIAFSDEEKKKKLMEITHGHIARQMLDILDKAVKNNIKYSCIVLDAPLLIESGLHKNTDEVWLVYADDETRLGRIMRRDNITREQALLRMNAQTSFDELKKYADVLIENSGGICELSKKAREGLGTPNRPPAKLP